MQELIDSLEAFRDVFVVAFIVGAALMIIWLAFIADRLKKIVEEIKGLKRK